MEHGIANNKYRVWDDVNAWEDMRIVPGAFSFLGSADPTLVAWQPGGSGATFQVWAFRKNDEAFASIQLPHAYKEGSDLLLHLHWTPKDRGVAEGAVNVGWKVDYSIANIGAAFPASTTADLSDACSGTDHQHELTTSVTIDGSAITVSSMIMLRIYRTDTGADDTWVGTTTAQSPALLEVDLHYQIDAPGSDAETSKT